MRRTILALALVMLGAPALAQEESPGLSFRGLLMLNPFAGTRAAPARRARVRHSPRVAPGETPQHSYDAMIAAQAQANGVPEALVHRVVKRESRYNAAAIGRGGAMGLMQIKHATARALGYTGPPAGLLDPETNLTYAVRYLAGALRAAGGDLERGYALYRSGYYTSKRRSARAARDAAAPPDAASGLRGAQ